MLLNVRLTKEEERVVRGLRRAKVNVSELVRRALREAERRGGLPRPRPSKVVDELLAAHPGPAVSGRPRLDDRRAVSRFIRRRLARG